MKHLKQLLLIAGISCGMMMTSKAQSTGRATAAEIKYCEGMLRTWGDGKSTNYKKTSSGLLYFQNGEVKASPKPLKFSKVKIKYSLATIDGKVTFVSIKKPIEIEMDQLPFGIQEAIKLMPIGSLWSICMPARLGDSKSKKIKDGRPLAGTVELFSIIK